MTMRHLSARAASGPLLALGALLFALLIPALPAEAAACERGSGVTVVVQGNGINGTHCVPNGASNSALSNLHSAGYSTNSVPNQPGTVCQINGTPAKNECWGLDSYWGIFWANGSGGSWNYSQQGAGSLKVGAGGWVGFRFQDSNSRKAPSAKPVGPAPKPVQTAAPDPEPKSKPKPSTQATKKPTAQPSASPTAKSEGKAATSPTAVPSGTPTAASPTPEASETTAVVGDEDLAATETRAIAAEEPAGPGVTVWIVIAVLLAAGGLVVWRVRQRR